jgi:luciferase family oxidoreductase group 1
MLPHYSPLKVAETFSMLSGLFPGRIDLGIGRSAGASPLFSYALQRDRRQPAPDDFRDQLDELLALLSNRPVPDTRFARLTSMHFESPEVWLLGSSQDSAVWAAELGLPYAFADFINPEGATIARCYRERFCPSERLKTPHTSVAALAICADTNEEAERLSLGPGAPRGRRIFTGTPERVREALEQLARDYEAEEVLIVNIRQDHGARRRSYELISQAFCLNDRNGFPA